MRKHLGVAIALACVIGFGTVAHASDIDAKYVATAKVWKAPAGFDVGPALLSVGIVDAPATDAAYAQTDGYIRSVAPRVFRDFRTIADSGGNVSDNKA